MKASHLDRVATHLARDMAHELSTAPSVQAYLNERQPPAAEQLGKADGR